MSNFMTYFKEGVTACKKLFAYLKALIVLIKAFFRGRTNNGFYEVLFTKIGRKWYCDVPGFPKELFEHTLMVGGASKFLDYYARDEHKLKAIVKVADEMEDKWFCGSRLYKTQSTLTGGAFYKDPSGNFNEEIWLCPVTLFLLGRYPERILLYRMNNSVLSCPIFFE